MPDRIAPLLLAFIGTVVAGLLTVVAGSVLPAARSGGWDPPRRTPRSHRRGPWRRRLLTMWLLAAVGGGCAILLYAVASLPVFGPTTSAWLDALGIAVWIGVLCAVVFLRQTLRRRRRR